MKNMTLELLKTLHLELLNLFLKPSNKKIEDHTQTIECKEPKIRFNDEVKCSDLLPSVENSSDDNYFCDTFKVTLRRTKTIPVHNRSSYHRYAQIKGEC